VLGSPDQAETGILDLSNSPAVQEGRSNLKLKLGPLCAALTAKMSPEKAPYRASKQPPGLTGGRDMSSADCCDEPKFEIKERESGRWFVAVITGNGPKSHVGDFATKGEAKEWISAKSKCWPSKPGATT
jgi:hypothetical protein